MSQYASTKDFEAAKAAELKIYGCDYDVFEKCAKESLDAQVCGLGFVVVSMLSDVQEMVQLAMTEAARQHLNLAKRFMHENKIGFNGK